MKESVRGYPATPFLEFTPMRHLLFFAVLSGLVASVSLAQTKVEVPFFGNEKCPYSGKPTSKEFFAEHEGERVYTCCKGCAKKADKEFATVKAKAYPTVKKIGNAKCPLMPKRDAKDSLTATFQGHEVAFCCKKCLANFKKEPNKALALATHPDVVYAKNMKCPVMEDEAVTADLFVIVGGHLVNICCGDCVDMIKEKPEDTLKTLGLTAKTPGDKPGQEKKSDDHKHDHGDEKKHGDDKKGN